MGSRRTFSIALIASVVAAVCTAAACFTLQAQEGAPAVGEPALGVLSSAGHKTGAVTFLEHLQKVRGPGEHPGGALSLYIPDPEQLYHYGDKKGVVTFLSHLPSGGGYVRLLVRDVERLERIAHKSQVLGFLDALSRRNAAMELLILDFRGLALAGRRAPLLGFLKKLPRYSSVHLYASPRDLTRYGDDADLLGFLDASPVPVEIHLDDPFLPAMLQAWVAADEARERAGGD